MTDFAAYHIATIPAGKYDMYLGDDTLFSVAHDSKTHYYAADAGTEEEFRDFVWRAWELTHDDEVEFEGRFAVVG